MPGSVALGVACGVALGIANAYVLARTTRMYVGARAASAVSLHAARVVLLAAVFVALALALPRALLATALGFGVAHLGAILLARRYA